MTPEGSKEAAEVMLAYANGKKIEYRWRGSSNWMEMDGYPVWNWEGYQYRIKPQQQTSIPATERELEIIDRYRWFMYRISPLAVEIQVMQKDLVIKKEGIKIFNPDTKCWEDWGEK